MVHSWRQLPSAWCGDPSAGHRKCSCCLVEIGCLPSLERCWRSLTAWYGWLSEICFLLSLTCGPRLFGLARCFGQDQFVVFDLGGAEDPCASVVPPFPSEVAPHKHSDFSFAVHASCFALVSVLSHAYHKTSHSPVRGCLYARMHQYRS